MIDEFNKGTGIMKWSQLGTTAHMSNVAHTPFISESLYMYIEDNSGIADIDTKSLKYAHQFSVIYPSHFW